MTSKALEGLEEAGGELVSMDEPAVLLEVLQGVRELETVSISAEELQRRILEQLMASEDVWAEPQTWSTKDSVGNVFLISSIRGVYPGKQQRQDGTRGVFCCYDAVDIQTGEKGILTSGASRVMTRLAVAWQRGELPAAVRIVVRSTTEDGNQILDVEKVEQT